MSRSDIQVRILVAALLPLSLMAFLLSVVFVTTRVGEVQEVYEQRARSLARQVASASEYGLFSGNRESLKAVLDGALREPDVLSVVVVDAAGRPVATSGRELDAPPTFEDMETMVTTGHGTTDRLTQPIRPATIALDEVFEQHESKAVSPVPGYVVLLMSRTSLLSRQNDIMTLGGLVTMAVLALGGFLAWRLSRSVARPVLDVARMVEQVGQGNLQARLNTVKGDTMHELKLGLNQMAGRLASVRLDMERQVAEATSELLIKIQEAETADRDKSRFLAAASHDLRQPTHALGLFVARLAQLPASPEVRALVVYLEDSVAAMQNLLDALLDVSRLDSGTVRVHQRPVPLEAVFKPLRDAWSSEAHEKGLRLRVRPSSLWVHSDEVLLQQILMNLVGNALRYTFQGSVLVTARLRDGGRWVRLEVRDSGVGIAVEHHQMIFREFYQVGNVERDRAKGLGLGLNIVDRTARLLGHRLHFQSSPGKGTCFALDVPVSRGPALTEAWNGTAAPEPLGAGLAAGTLQGVTVMVVEDDALALAGLTGLLQSWGCVVLSAGGRLEALGQFSAAHVTVDVVLSDFRLPDGENGIALVGELRAMAQRGLPAALMSGDTDPQLMQRARQAGLPLLHKPVRPAKLRSLLRHLCSDRWDADASPESKQSGDQSCVLAE